MADGRVEFDVVANTKGINQSIKEVTNNIETESRKWDKAADQSAGEAAGSWAGAVSKIAGAFSAAGIVAMFAKWGKAAVSAASDLAEVQNVVDVTFGDGAKKIDAWAKQAGSAFGLTETQAKRYTSTLGAMMKSSGLSGDAIIGMSTDLAGLAADMASFYNLDFDTAFEKLRSGISGETEPLKQLGVNMSVANLEAFALEQGITKSYTAMSQAEQTTLRYQYIMKATADAQGDFARTADGYANASRRMATAMETIKTKGGQLLMQVVEPITVGIADLLDTITEAPDRTVLDDFADINADTAKKMSDLQATYDRATDVLNVIREIYRETANVNGSQVSFEELFKGIAEVEKSGGNIRDYIAGLGLDVDYVVQKYQTWQAAVRELTSSVPTLTAVINEETGAIDGGTDAIQRNLDEWKNAEEQKLEWTAYYAKARALEEKKAEMYSYELAAGAAQQKVKRLRENLIKTYDWVTESAFGDNGLITPEFARQNGSRFVGDVIWAFDEYLTAVNELNTANAEYTVQSGALADAEAELADAHQYLIDKYGEEGEAATTAGKKAEDGAEKTKKALSSTTKAAHDAIKAVADYVQAVHDSTMRAVDNIVKGFDVISRPTTELEEKRSRLIKQQMALNLSTKEGRKQYNDLQKQIDDLNDSIEKYSPTAMKNGLRSQIAFMDEYIKNLEKAKEMGLSNELLASLADGSVESAEYLAALVANPEQAKQIDALFGEVQAKKKEFADSLTDVKLAGDEVYSGLVDVAKAAIAELDLSGDARASMGATIQGLADGITDKEDAVRQAVDGIVAQLSRLGGYGIGINFNSFGDIGGSRADVPTKPWIQGEYETGLDYVPFDGFLASLHEGESILTAEEARVWNRFKNGASPQTMDYDALGETMRDNVHAGGNVYLNGREVGRVISAQQGNDYRAMQRSGFQA